MALPHAKHLDVINVAPLGNQLPGTVSTSLIKTDRIQLLHMVLSAHQEQPMHHVDDECTIHCLEGEVDLMMGAGVRQLRPGNVIVLPPGQPHALKARAQSAVLVTLLLHGGDAGNQGGAGNRRAPDKDSPTRA
ncbi:cupin domain-containing protein [Ramlibacter alkalitolerans]|uniref:Cupin domain-containing protein n=1 Tax=Ramlibacter alkalitolerans TaxID=2039631 RepID=A0ABS1JKG3_9BURK|nr:cupin domain-containing protein [Ramlibacter alkalitolerans]MBL0424411.1 cupin domain-containing protein [Ramlibacter alkalitolerans]